MAADGDHLLRDVPATLGLRATLVGGEMFLPPVFSVDLKGLPPIDKNLMASIAAIVACLIIKPRALLRGSRGDKGKRYNWFILLLIVGAFFTARTNPDPVRWEKLLFQGLTFHDFVSEAIRLVLFWWPPFFLGRKLFKRPEDLEALFTVLVVGGLVYSLFIFIEARLSPQLNIWIYGYHQADFRQSLRGGDSPDGVMRHGLNVSLFILMTLLSAVGLARSGKRVVGIPVVWLAVYLAFVLLVCKSTGAVVYAIVIVPLLLIASAKKSMRASRPPSPRWCCVIQLLRFLGLVPVDDIVSFFNSLVGPERAESLAYRLKNEEICGPDGPAPLVRLGRLRSTIHVRPLGKPDLSRGRSVDPGHGHVGHRRLRWLVRAAPHPHLSLRPARAPARHLSIGRPAGVDGAADGRGIRLSICSPTLVSPPT